MVYVQKAAEVSKDPFDVVFSTYFDVHEDFKQLVNDYINAGVTWIVECFDPWRGDFKKFEELVKLNPKTYFD